MTRISSYVIIPEKNHNFFLKVYVLLLHRFLPMKSRLFDILFRFALFNFVIYIKNFQSTTTNAVFFDVLFFDLWSVKIDRTTNIQLYISIVSIEHNIQDQTWFPVLNWTSECFHSYIFVVFHFRLKINQAEHLIDLILYSDSTISEKFLVIETFIYIIVSFSHTKRRSIKHFTK